MWRKFWSGPSSALLLLILAGCDQPPPVESSIAAPAILLPEMGQLSNFTLTDQNGNAFASDRMRDRIWVVDFIYTTCQAACPRMSREMTKVQEAMKDDPGVRLLSISVDPQHDTPQVLKAFGERYRADFTRWSFLTGKADLIRKLQREASVDMDPEQIEQSHNKCFIDRKSVV